MTNVERRMSKGAALRLVLGSAVHTDWSQFEGLAALRCTVGVAIPLAAGLLLRQPSISAFGAIGAVSVGFGSFPGAYCSPPAVMISASSAMAIALFTGSIAGHSDAAAIVVAAIAA